MGDITSRGSLTFSYFHAFTFLIAGHVVSTDLRQRLMRPYLLNESHSICLLILRSHPLQMFQKYIFVVWPSTVAKKNEYNNDEEDSLITWNVINCFCFLLMRVSRYYYRCILCIKRLVSANLCNNKISHETVISYCIQQEQEKGESGKKVEEKDSRSSWTSIASPSSRSRSLAVWWSRIR